MIATPRRSGPVLKGWHVLAGFLVFFGVDIAVNTVFMVSAYRTFPGEISMTPYEDGIAFNASLRQRRASRNTLTANSASSTCFPMICASPSTRS